MGLGLDETPVAGRLIGTYIKFVSDGTKPTISIN
jgi:hypothetical protein